MAAGRAPKVAKSAAAQALHVGATGVVLAGGQSRRLGRDKAVEPIGGQPLIRRVIERLQPLSEEIVVVVADQARGDALPLDRQHRVVLDRYPDTGSLGGIFSGLEAAQSPWIIAVACDMPFLNISLLRHLMSLRENADAVVPVVDGRPEPTHALYAKSCLPFIAPRLVAGDLKISGFYDEVRVSYVPDTVVATLDPGYLSFFNVNTPQDLEKALGLVAQGR